jgi:hypothetical protein
MSVICAIYPKEKWPRTKAKGPNCIQNGAWGYYGLSALAAAITSTCFSAIWQFAFSLGSPSKFLEALTQKYPYALVAFVTTFATACCADFVIGSKCSPGPHKYSPRSARWEAAIQVIAGLVVAYIVRIWLGQTLVGQAPPPLLVLMLVFATIGGLIGYFVPSWYRQGQAEKEFHLTRDAARTQSAQRQETSDSKTAEPTFGPAVQQSPEEVAGK